MVSGILPAVAGAPIMSPGYEKGQVMGEEDSRRLLALLEDIRENQKLQIDRQFEALELQRRQFAILEKQQERADRIQDRAEQIQNKSAQLVAGARKVMIVVIPIIIALIIYLSWLMFRR